MTTPNAALCDAIEQSYAAFSAMPRPSKLEASPLRNAGHILATLSAAPLRKLTGEQVGPYSGWAITTVGDDRDYRHFLPRILELSVEDPVWLGAEPPVIASKLVMANWRGWPEGQSKAVLCFMRAAFNWVIEQHPDSAHSAALWTCGLTKLGDEPTLTFKRWLSSRSPNAALQMALFMIEEAKSLRRHQEVRGSFWDDVAVETRRNVAEHLTSDASKAFLRAAETRVIDEDRFNLLDAALAELQRQG